MKYTKEQRETARESLRKIIRRGDVVYVSLASVSRSGMTRHIKVYVVFDGEIVPVGKTVATLINLGYDREGGVIVHGAGQDMGDCLVDLLGSYLFTLDELPESSLVARWI